MQKIKKRITIVLLTLSMFLLVGWGGRAVELLNDTPLIDLNKAIQEAPIGNQGKTQTTEEKESKSDESSKNNQSESMPDTESIKPQTEKKETIIIEIRDTIITYNNRVCKDTNALKNKIIYDCSDGEYRVYLVDDYAEKHVYDEVCTMLEQLHETIGLEYGFD